MPDFLREEVMSKFVTILSGIGAWLGRLVRRRRESPVATLDALPPGDGDQSLVLRAALKDLLLDRRAERRSKTLRATLYFLMFALPAFLYVGFYAWSAGIRLGKDVEAVAVIRIEGEIADGALASAGRVIPVLKKAFEDPKVKALVLSIDSGGGAPLEAERIYTAIDSWRKTHPKPVVAVINNLGASAAYMIALHADRIYAGHYSLVGSVGAILSGWDAHQALARVGVSQRVYASGELKAMMNPYLPMSPEAEAKARDLVAAMGKSFRAELTAQRKEKLVADVDYGSGAVWGGPEAHRIGLVDELSTIDQVVKTRWPGLPVNDLGPRSTGLPFASAAADWLGQVLASGMSRVQAQAQAQAQVSLR